MFNAIPMKIPMTFITEIEKSTLKYIWKHKRPWTSKAMLSKKSNTASITLPTFKLYYRATAIKMNESMNQWKHSMTLAQKQTWRPVEQRIRPRYQSIQLCPSDFWQRCPKHMMGGEKKRKKKRQPLQQILLGKLGICMQKTEIRSMSFTLYKYQLKLD
jgi:hypothetical protein